MVALGPLRVNWRALLKEEMWLLLCKFALTCLLTLMPDSVFVPLVVLMLILVSIAAQVEQLLASSRLHAVCSQQLLDSATS